jgi:hypothetical protein
MLILASSSPRRRELLTQAGFSFEVHPAHIPEDPLPREDPLAYVTRLAREKAEAAFHQLTQDPTRPTEGSALCQGTTSVVPQMPQNDAGALAPEVGFLDRVSLQQVPKCAVEQHYLAIISSMAFTSAA